MTKISYYFTRSELKMSLLVFIIYSVGIAGITIPVTGEYFIRMIPLVLILSLAAGLAFHGQPWDLKTIVVFTAIVVFSWIIEAAGVKTGILFGKYAYGPALGLKLLDTPLLIGLNWLLLVYGTFSIAESLPMSQAGKVISASVLMVMYDTILEQTAPVLGMWQFEGGIVPLRNYVAWFIVAAMFHTIIRLSGVKIRNRVAVVIFAVQFIFFLNLVLIFHFTK